MELLGVTGKYTVLQLYRNKFDKRLLTSANVSLVIGSRKKKRSILSVCYPATLLENMSGHLFTLHPLA